MISRVVTWHHAAAGEHGGNSALRGRSDRLLL
jgi:hypothetical protein